MATNQDIAHRAVSWLLTNGDVFNDPQSTMPTRDELLEHPVNNLNVDYYAKRMSEAKFNNIRHLKSRSFGTYQVHHSTRRQIFIESGGVFWPVAVVQSYAVKIATVVINMYTRNVELWLTVRRYSDTTQRHISKVRSAFIHATRYGDTPSYRDAEIFETPAVEAEMSRVDAAVLAAHGDLQQINTILHHVITPKVHEGTRRGAVTAATWRLQNMQRHMTYGTPYETPSDPDPRTTTHNIRFDYNAALRRGEARMTALREVDTMLAFTTRLTHTADNPVPLADLRAQVEAYFALEGDHGRA